MPNLKSDAQIETMSSGNAGMYLQTSAVQNALLRGAAGKFELRAAAMPAFAGKRVHPTNSGSALVIMTKDPARQRAAWALMKHLTSDYGYTIITSRIGYLPQVVRLHRDAQRRIGLDPYGRLGPVVTDLKAGDAGKPTVGRFGHRTGQPPDLMRVGRLWASPQGEC